VRCELEALPKRGNILGALVDSASQAAVPAARVKIRDRQGRELDVVANETGTFRIEKVLPGTVTILVEAPGYFASTNEFSVKALEDTQARILLNKRPDKPNVVVQGKELKLKKQAHFQHDSAEILPDSMAILGVEPSRLEAKGYGDTKPLMPNTTDANKARNRRVQLIIKN